MRIQHWPRIEIIKNEILESTGHTEMKKLPCIYLLMLIYLFNLYFLLLQWGPKVASILSQQASKIGAAEYV